MDVVLLRRFYADQFEAVSGKFPELSEILRRNKRTSDKVKFIEVCDLLGILFVRFLAFDGFDIFGMCEADIDVVFEIIKNRNSRLTSGFHANMIAIIPDEPVVKPLDIRADGWKRFLLYLDILSLSALTMVAMINFLWTSRPQQMEYFNFIINITTLIKKE